MSLVTIGSESIRVDVDAERGGRVAQIHVGDTPLLVAHGPDTSDATAWGAFPMVPWAGRIRRGQFTFDGETHELPINMGDHAIHGVGFTSRWDVSRAEPTLVELSLALPSDRRWPFGGHVRQVIEVHDRSVTFTMTVTADDRAFPVSFGWHPWFRKPTAIDFRPEAMYRRDADHIAVDELVAVPDGPWDDCFVNRRPVRLRIDDVDVELSSDCTHWVVYDEPDHATCVEPQTGPPDAFNIAPHVLVSGQSHTAAYRLDWLGSDHSSE